MTSQRTAFRWRAIRCRAASTRPGTVDRDKRENVDEADVAVIEVADRERHRCSGEQRQRPDPSGRDETVAATPTTAVPGNGERQHDQAKVQPDIRPSCAQPWRPRSSAVDTKANRAIAASSFSKASGLSERSVSGQPQWHRRRAAALYWPWSVQIAAVPQPLSCPLLRNGYRTVQA